MVAVWGCSGSWRGAGRESSPHYLRVSEGPLHANAACLASQASAMSRTGSKAGTPLSPPLPCQIRWC